MAPPEFPNGMTLHTLGFAALKYPALPPPPVNVPLSNQLGALQYQPLSRQNQAIAQIASQYLTALIDYQTSDEPTLHDPSLPQYYFSTALGLLNFMISNPDVAKRVAAHPTLFNNIIEKMLAPNFVTDMKAAPRPSIGQFPPSKFDDEFGLLLQFVSTMLLYKEEMGEVHPRIGELVPLCKTWMKTYKNSPTRTIKAASERLVDQIPGLDPEMIMMMRQMQDKFIVCGVASCGIKGKDKLTVCGTCRMQRYCGTDHQKADWKYHKNICVKGLKEEA